MNRCPGARHRRSQAPDRLADNVRPSGSPLSIPERDIDRARHAEPVRVPPRRDRLLRVGVRGKRDAPARVGVGDLEECVALLDPCERGGAARQDFADDRGRGAGVRIEDRRSGQQKATGTGAGLNDVSGEDRAAARRRQERTRRRNLQCGVDDAEGDDKCRCPPAWGTCGGLGRWRSGHVQGRGKAIWSLRDARRLRACSRPSRRRCGGSPVARPVASPEGAGADSSRS